MPKPFKINHCLFCPKVFCCSECRYKHESTFHKKDVCLICAKMTKSPISQKRNQSQKTTDPVPSVVQGVKFAEAEPDENSPKTPFQENGKVKQMIVKFSCMTSVSSSDEKDRKSIDNEASIYQGDSQQFSRQIVATSTPYQINNAMVSNETDNSIENKDENNVKIKDNNCEMKFSTYTSDLTEYLKSNFTECKDLQGRMENELSNMSNFINIPVEAKNLRFSDTPNYRTNERPSHEVDPNNTTLEEQDNVANEQADSKGIDTMLWVTASNISVKSDSDKEHLSSVDEQENNPSQYVEVYKSPCSSKDTSTDVIKEDGSMLSMSSSSISELSQSVWKTITNSLRSAMNTTKDICNITSNISKRSLDIIDYPSAKRRKYEPFLKCRPPIHEMREIVMLKLSSNPILKVDKSTQTEDCYFT